MVLSILPIKENTNQTFDCILPLNNSNFRFRFSLTWNPLGEYWQLSVFDTFRDNLEVVNYKPLNPVDYPYNNIIANLSYKNIGSLYIVNNSGKNEVPSYTNLAQDFVIVWGDNR